MPSAVRLREDYSAEALRALARRSKDANQSRRLLSLAAIRDGMDRGAAARIGGMDRQTLRGWVHRFNGSGPQASSTLDRRSQASPVGGATGTVCADRRDRPGS
jgi:Winged helix-turn helix